MLRQFKKGQSTAEYAIVIGLVIAAAVAMQVYVKRGIQGKMKDATDFNDPSATMMTTRQYEPDYMTTTAMVSSRKGEETATTSKGGGITRSITGEEVSSRTGTQTILAP